MAAAVPIAGSSSWPLQATAPDGPATPLRPESAAVLAERCATVEQLLVGHCGQAEQLAAQLSDLHAVTRRLVAELAAIARTEVRSSRQEGLVDALGLHVADATSKDLPGMLRDEGPAQAERTTGRELPGIPVVQPIREAPMEPACRNRRESADSTQGHHQDRRESSNSISQLSRKVSTHLNFRTKSGHIFADSEQMKEQVLMDLTEEAPDISAYYRKVGWCQRVARSQAFESFSLAVICINAVWIGVEIDLNHANVLSKANPVFQAAAHSFCVFFVLELYVRVMAFESKRHALKDRWLLFDAFLVVMMVFETWVMLLAFSVGSTFSTANLNVLAVFRVLRLLRVLRLARVLREMDELLVMVRAIAIAFRAISIVLVLLGLLIYMGAIVFRVLLEDTALGARRFGTLPAAMGTLLLEATLSGTRGGPVIREATSEHIFYGFLILVFVLVANITMMGVLGGLLVQTVKTVAEVEKEEAQVKRVARKMDELWADIVRGETRTDSICEGQLKNFLRKRRDLPKKLQDVGVDVEALVSASGFIFDQHEGQLGKPQLKRMVLDLRGKNAAKVKDHVETRRFVAMAFKRSGCRTSQTDGSRPSAASVELA